MTHPNVVNGPNPVAVLDTNVVLDFMSIHNSYDALEAGTKAERDFRWHRAGDGLRLAIHLNEIGAATADYDAEVLRILEAKADPTKPSFKREYVRLYVTFVWDLFPNWNRAELRLDGEPKGDQADRALVEIAGQLGVPLITQELNPKKMIRKHAAKLGVLAQTPKEFCGSGPTKGAIERFMERFAAQAPTFRKGEADYEFTRKVLGHVYNYYVDVLEETAPASHRRTA